MFIVFILIISGKYRGAAHAECNINYKDTRTISVVFHNLTGYDAHLLIQEVACGIDGQVNLLPLTKEKYISFTKIINFGKYNTIKFKFIDSLRFMNSSLDKLSSYLSNDDLVILKKEFKNLSNYQLNLLKRKGVFPYEYVDGLEKLDEMKLPSIENFNSTLNGSNISIEEYQHAINVWNAFEDIRTLGDYSDYYLKVDVLLLAEIFENFRNNCMETYGLDPAHYYTTPGFSWDCMLKYTKVKLELMSDIDMVLFIEKGIRGGINQCCNRYSKANNKYMKDKYNNNEESKYIVYYDVNNLYGHSMSESLPYGEFEWVKNLKNTDFFFVGENSDYGYILEVDLDYPQSLHNKHKDLPFCPVHEKPPNSKIKKLLTTLERKEKYVIHYKYLKQAIDNGLELKKVHRALKFKQSKWLKEYIDLNTLKRKEATNESKRNLYKLMNNVS